MLLPALCRAVVAEREDGVVHALRIAGLSPPLYWLGAYFFLALLGAGFATCFVLGGHALGVHCVSHASGPVWASLVLGWAHAQACVAVLLSALATSSRAASVGAWVVLLAVSIGAGSLNESLERWPNALLALPPLAYARALFLVLQRGGQTILFGSELWRALAHLYYTSGAWLILGVYLHHVLPGEGGAAAQPFFCLGELPTLSRRRRGRRVATDRAHAKVAMAVRGGGGGTGRGTGRGDMCSSTGSADGDSVGGGMAHEGAGWAQLELDVEREAEAATQLDAEFHYAVCVQRLGKRFGSQVAVEDLSFKVEYGECFGLLGPNGAGKTSTFSILTGVAPASWGDAFVDGVSVRDDMRRIYGLMGFVPQFDTVWRELSVRQHFLLFGRLKGASEADLSALVQRVAEAVELDGDALHAPAGTLSGGMRRRLSLGIALLGAPRVLFLDEPTTGLDPEARRAVWQTVQLSKADRSIVLTTHSMEEADALCSRIGIMVRGRLRCVGTQVHLKAAYGEGHKLSLLVTPQHAVEAFLAQRCPGAALIHSFGHLRVYALPRPTPSLLQVFFELQQRSHMLGVKEFALSHTTMEEVFVNIVNRSGAPASLPGAN